MKWDLFSLRRNRKPARRQPYRKSCRPRVEWLEPRLAPANVPITTAHLDYNLTGWNSQETALTPQNVNDAGFGKLFSYTVDGYTYAQPLYVPNLTVGGAPRNVVIAATEHDSLYAFNADAPTGGPANNGLLWQTSFLIPRAGFTVTTMPSGETLSGDIVPEVGITGTPVIDTASNTLFVDAKTKEVENATGTAHWVQRLYAIDITTGAIRASNGVVTIGDTTGDNNNTSPISVPGTGAGSVNGVLTFNAKKENDRMALQLVTNPDSSKTVYLSWASHGDNGPYHGWVVGYNAANLGLQKVYCTSPNGSASGIWESGGNLGVDAQGNLYFSTGNGFGTGNDAMLGANTALGSGGGGLGYQTITNSLAVTFRTFDNGHSSTGLGQNGNFLTPTNDLTGQIDFNAAAQAATPHTFQATLSYNASTQVLTETLRDLTANTGPFTFNYPNVNLAQLLGGNTAYVGFTGGTGGLNAEQDLLSWAFTGGGATSINHPSGLAGATDLTANGSASLTAYPTATNTVGAFSYHQDLGVPGNPTPPGTAAFNSATGTYTLTGSGTDLGFPLNNNDYDADRFQFAYNSMSGTTGSIIARVLDMTGSTNPNDPTYWSKAMVQIRNSLDPQAQNVSVIMSPHNVSEMTWRDNFGGGTGAHERGTGTGPIPGWIRLDRAPGPNGTDVFTGYWAVDNNGTPGTWQLGETHTLPSSMGSNVYVGIGFTSHSNGVTGTAHFDHVSVTGFAPQTPPAAAVITPAANGQAGSIFSTSKVDVTNFSTTFTFRMVAGSNPIADGMTFTLENQVPGQEYSESVLKLSPTGAGQNMTVADFFTPHDWQRLDSQDADLGSGGTLLLPDAVGSAAHPHLMIETGKTGRIYLIDRDNMGKFNSRIDPVLQTVQIGGPGVWGNPAFFQDGPNTGLIYYWGQSAPGQAFRVTNGVINPIPASVTTFNMGFPGGQPSISSNGTSGSTGIMWVLRSDNYGSNGPESLLAFNAENLSQLLWGSTDVTGRDAIGGTSVKFTFPIVSNGHVYAGSNGTLAVYGLLPANTAAPATPTNFQVSQIPPEQGGDTKLLLSWTNPSPNNATLIKIERSTAGAAGPFTQIAEVAPTLSSFTDTGLSPVTHYWYRVRATNQLGDSAYTTVGDAFTRLPAAKLSITNVTSTEVDLSWTTVISAAAGNHYNVERSTDNFATFTTIASNLPPGQTSFVDTTVVRPNTYQYRVHAFNAASPTDESFSNVNSAVVAPVDIEFPFPAGISNANGLQFNGSALFSPTEQIIRLNNDFNQGGSVFTTDRVNVSNFSTSFWIRLHEGTQPNPADGLTFTLQADPRGPAALGAGGGGLGYQGIAHSIAIKFDVFNNEGETSNSTGVFANGDYPGVPHGPFDVNVPLDPTVVNLQDQDRKRIDINYTVATQVLDVKITDETVQPNRSVEQRYLINVPAVIGSDGAYVGFTGGTGGLFTLQDVLGWVFPPTAPPGPVNLQVTTGTSDATLTWANTATNENSLVVQRSLDGYHFTTRASLPLGTTTYHDTGLATNTAYFYRVQAINSLGAGSSNVVQVAIAAAAVVIDHSAGFDSNNDLQANGNATFFNPAPAAGTVGTFTAQQDIGTAGDPMTAGTGTFDSSTGRYVLTASGSDIWDVADHMHYLYKPLTGDGEIIARVVGENSTDYWTKAGLMIRKDTTAGSPNAFMFETADAHDEPVFQWRDSQDGGSADFGGHPGNDVGNKPPVWLRLVRSGNTFSGYWAADINNGQSHGPWMDLAGNNTTRFDAHTVPGIGPNDTVLVGLGITAHNNSTVASVTFDHVSVVTSARLTDGGGGEAGSIFTKNRVPVFSTWNTSYVMNVRSVNGSADGSTFTLQTVGPSALGGAGGSLGFGGIAPSIGIKFDLYSQGSHASTTGLYVNGATGAAGQIDMTSAGIDFRQNHTYQVDLSYDGASLRESLKDLVSGKTFTTSYPINIQQTLGSDTAFVGFTGGTGGETAWQAVESWTGTFNSIVVPPHLEQQPVYPPATATAGTPFIFTLSEKTVNGSLIPTYTHTVHFSSSDPRATLPPDYTFTTGAGGDNGTHTFAAVFFTAGTQSITATDTSTSDSNPFPLPDALAVVVTPAATSGLAVFGYPSPTTAGDAHTFTVTAVDPYGNRTPVYRGMVHFSSSDGQAGLPGDYTFTSADAGQHLFSATLFTAGTQSLTATDAANHFSATQGGIVVNPAAASTMVLVGYPSPTTAGAPGNFTVTVYDPYGNVAAGYTGMVHFSSSDGQAGLPADYTFTAADAGQHVFSATLKTAGTQSLTATDTANPNLTATQGGIVVNPAAASALVVAGYPSPTVKGDAHNFTVTAYDPYGNVATGYTGTVTFSSSDDKATLPDDYTFTSADAGVHTFSATFQRFGTQSLTATDTANPSITGTQDGIEVVNQGGGGGAPTGGSGGGAAPAARRPGGNAVGGAGTGGTGGGAAGLALGGGAGLVPGAPGLAGGSGAGAGGQSGSPAGGPAGGILPGAELVGRLLQPGVPGDEGGGQLTNPQRGTSPGEADPLTDSEPFNLL
jgi:hypothetical protein